jgi:Na+-translocating ferredoxin:NAD+ oxidoreductase RnfD subunit
MRPTRLYPLVAALVVVMLLASSAFAEPTTSPKVRTAQATVHAYFKILNAGMKSGNFSALSTVYAPNATLTQSNPLGQTKVSHGLTEITAFYEGAYSKFAGYEWTQDAMRSLAKTVVLSYEHAGSPPLTVAGRCAHLFVVKHGMIQSLDWTTFYSGQK